MCKTAVDKLCMKKIKTTTPSGVISITILYLVGVSRIKKSYPALDNGFLMAIIGQKNQ